jgi:ketosteroid isomerase-like protein
LKSHIAICSLFLAVVLSPLAAQAQTVPGTPADERAIRQLVAAHANSAQRDDVDGMIATMHRDADTRLDDGTFLVGSKENAQFLQHIVAGGPHRLAHVHPAESTRIRFLQPDVAFVDVDSVSMSGSGPKTPYFLVVTKVENKWGVAVVRNGPDMK